MDMISSYFLIDKILYSSPDFLSGKDIIHPKRPPIQEAPSGQKRYRYAVLPDLFCKDTIKYRIYFLSTFGLTIKKSAHSADFKGCLRLKTAGQANDRLELLRIPPKRLCLRAHLEGLGGTLTDSIPYTTPQTSSALPEA